MDTTTVRVSVHTRELISELAVGAGTSMQAIVEEAVEAYRRQQLLLEANAAYANLREDEPAWNAFQEELSVWEAALADGLEEV